MVTGLLFLSMFTYSHPKHCGGRKEEKENTRSNRGGKGGKAFMQIDHSLSLPKETQPFKIYSDWQSFSCQTHSGTMFTFWVMHNDKEEA